MAGPRRERGDSDVRHPFQTAASLGGRRPRELGPVAWLTVIVPGIVLLVAMPFFGPMPRAVESSLQV
jgi:hypothetical protein